MKGTIPIILFAVGLLLNSSCSKAVIEVESNEVEIKEPVSYNTHIAPMMTNFCTTCHGGAAPSGGFALQDYETVKFYGEQGKLVHRMNSVSNPMPPSGLLPSLERKTVEKWVKDGFPK